MYIGTSSFCSSSQSMMPLITGNYVYFEFSMTACNNNTSNNNTNTKKTYGKSQTSSSSSSSIALALGLSPPDAPLNVMVCYKLVMTSLQQ